MSFIYFHNNIKRNQHTMASEHIGTHSVLYVLPEIDLVVVWHFFCSPLRVLPEKLQITVDNCFVDRKLLIHQLRLQLMMIFIVPVIIFRWRIIWNINRFSASRFSPILPWIFQRMNQRKKNTEHRTNPNSLFISDLAKIFDKNLPFLIEMDTLESWQW